MENRTCKTCKDNDNGLCDRTGQLIDDDDCCNVRYTNSKADMQTACSIDKKVIIKSIQHYGQDNQSTVCMEECAELIQAISKAKRGKIDRNNMEEEIADVLICVEMLKLMYSLSDSNIDEWILKKQQRESERMKRTLKYF